MQLNINIINFGCQQNFNLGEIKKPVSKEKELYEEKEVSADSNNLAFDVNSVKEKYLPSKLKSEQLEQVYIDLKEYGKAEQVHVCGSYLEFISKYKDFHEKKLNRLNSCKRRLCPFCSWRRSLKVFNNIKAVIDEIGRTEKGHCEDKSRFLFLTLTTKNVTLEYLSDEVDNILKSFYKFAKYKDFKNAFLGYCRALEITIDRNKYITSEMYFSKKDYYKKNGLSIGDNNPNFLMANVHIHVLLHTTYAIYRGAFLSHSALVSLWKKALNVNYEPVVDIRKFKAKNKHTKGKELAEVAKYTVKPADYLGLDAELNKKIVYFLDLALFNRRILGLGGTFKTISRKLKLDYENLKDELNSEDAKKYILQYYYHFDKKKYIKIR